MPASNILCERLKQLEEILDISPEEMANMGDCGRSTYYRYRNGETVPDILFLNNILKNENSINAEWLLKGEKPVLKRTPNVQGNPGNNPIQFLTFPLYAMRPLNNGAEGRLPLEEWQNSSQTLPLCSTFIETVMNPDNPHRLFAMMVKCDSMRPEIEPESLVLVDKDKMDPSSDGIFVVRIDEYIRMKVIQRLPSQRLQLSTLSDKFNPIEIGLNEDNFEIIGRIIWRGSSI